MKKIVLSFLTLAMFSFLSFGQCDDPQDVQASGVTSSSATITWDGDTDHEEWEIVWVLEGEDPLEEENHIGFETVDVESFTIEGLDAAEAYDAHVRALCDDDVNSEWVAVSFTTDEDEDECADPTELTAEVEDGDATITWEEGDATEWEILWVEDGDNPLDDENHLGFETVTETTFTIEGLEDGTYDVYVRAVCDDEVTSEWVSVSFTIGDEDECADPTELTAEVEDGDATITWEEGDATEWEILWVEDGDNPLDDENHLGFETVSEATFTIEGLEEGTYDVYVRAVCDDEVTSEWVSVSFTIEEDEEENDYVWYSDFEDESIWVIDNDGEVGAQYGWSITSTAVGWTLPRINSTSGGKFAEMANGNPTLNPGTQALGVTYTMTTAEPINLTELGGSWEVTLEFEQFGATFNDLQEVMISTNGTTFTPVYDNSAREALTAAGGSAYDNPEVIRVNLAPFLDGTTPDDLYIRFSWTTALPEFATNPNVWVAYGWMIDDVKIVKNDEYDLSVNASSWGSIGGFGELLAYPRVPTAQTTEVQFNATMFNNGTGTQTGASFGINVNQGEVVETSVPATLAPYASADATVSFTPDGNGSYSVARSVTSDFIEDDAQPSNNQLSNVNILVNDFIYARDNNVVNGSISNADDGTEIGNIFDIFADQTLYGITFRLNGGANGTPAGTEVFVKLYRVTGDFDFVDESEPVTLAGNQLNQFITIPLSQPINVSAGETYLAVVGSFDGGLVVSGAGPAPDQTVFLYDYPEATWFFTRTTAMVRLNFDPTVNTQEVVSNVSEMNIYPNPTSTSATIDFDLMHDTDVEVIVTDISGKTMAINNLGTLHGGKQTTSIDASSFANGIYFVTVKTNDAKSTLKFIKK